MENTIKFERKNEKLLYFVKNALKTWSLWALKVKLFNAIL